jgi:hypothetical protein
MDEWLKVHKTYVELLKILRGQARTGSILVLGSHKGKQIAHSSVRESV